MVPWMGTLPFLLRKEDHPRTDVSHPHVKAIKFGHLEGGITRSLGDLRSPWILTTYKSWDDPPSSFDGNQKSGKANQLRLVVEIPLFPRLYLRWLAGFRNHQQYHHASVEHGPILETRHYTHLLGPCFPLIAMIVGRDGM